MLLSNEAPWTMPRAARPMSAVESTSTGGLPGPAVIARLVVLSASSTTPGPPVTISRRIFSWCISRCADSIVGSGTVQTRLGGPPAAMMAWLIRTTLSTDTRLA